MSTSTEEFSRLSTEVAADLKPLLSEHLADFDEMLPHLFFSDVSRWVSAEVAKSDPSPQVKALLDLLETSYPTADFNVQNLIDVSFIEMVEDDPAVVRLLGPQLLARVDPQYRL